MSNNCVAFNKTHPSIGAISDNSHADPNAAIEYSTGTTTNGFEIGTTKHDKLRHLPRTAEWFDKFVELIDCILAKKELTIKQLEWTPTFVRSLAELIDFGGQRGAYEGFKNAFWRCIHQVDSLIFMDYEFMKQLRCMLCEARQIMFDSGNGLSIPPGLPKVAPDVHLRGMDKVATDAYLKDLGF